MDEIPALVNFESLDVVVIDHQIGFPVVFVLYLAENVHKVVQHQFPVNRLLLGFQKTDCEDLVEADDEVLPARVAQSLELEPFGLVVDVDVALELQTFFHQKRLWSGSPSLMLFRMKCDRSHFWKVNWSQRIVSGASLFQFFF